MQYLSCYDGPALGQLLGNFAKMENESMILGSIYSTISNLSVKQGNTCKTFVFGILNNNEGDSCFLCNLVEDNEIFDFRGIRLDWYRLQSFLSHTVSRIQGLSYLMNTTIFHLKLVDFQDELLLETSDLSLFWYGMVTVRAVASLV